MDLKERMQDLDARIAARREALDKKLGLASAEEQPAVSEPAVSEPAFSDPAVSEPAASASPDGPAPSGPDPVPAEEPGSASAPGRKGVAPSGKKDASGAFGKILADMDAGLEIPGLFTIPGIVVKILFVLFCLSAIGNLFWAIRYCFFYHPHAYAGVYVDGCYVRPSYWWMFWPVLFEAGCAWLLWWLCARKKK